MRYRLELRLIAATVILLFVAAGADYLAFLYHQRHGGTVSFVSVRKYDTVGDQNGHYHIAYVGSADVPCTEALLPHQAMPPCWWVEVHRFHWVSS